MNEVKAVKESLLLNCNTTKIIMFMYNVIKIFTYALASKTYCLYTTRQYYGRPKNSPKQNGGYSGLKTN